MNVHMQMFHEKNPWVETAKGTECTWRRGTAACAQSGGRCQLPLAVWAPASAERRRPWTIFWQNIWHSTGTFMQQTSQSSRERVHAWWGDVHWNVRAADFSPAEIRRPGREVKVVTPQFFLGEREIKRHEFQDISTGLPSTSQYKTHLQRHLVVVATSYRTGFVSSYFEPDSLESKLFI